MLQGVFPVDCSTGELLGTLKRLQPSLYSIGMQRDGLLTQLSLAFSRDQPDKIYVQDRIREQGAELWRWLQEGAQLYICGDASRMAKDVDQALHQIAQRHGGLNPESAAHY